MIYLKVIYANLVQSSSSRFYRKFNVELIEEGRMNFESISLRSNRYIFA